MLGQLLPAEVFGFLLVFARVGTALMTLPGIGDGYVTPRVRLGLGLALSAVIWPLLRQELPALPGEPLRLFLLLGGEILYGLMLGGIARLIVSALHVAGIAISFMSGLSYAQSLDPSQEAQGSLLGGLLTLMGVVLIFTSGLHMLLIAAIHDSYTLFPVGSVPPVDDFTQLAVRTVAGAFAVGIQMAAPFIVYGIVFYVGLGLLQRLMPQVQLFFVAIPLQMAMAFFMLMVVTAAFMLWFLDFYREATAPLLAGG